MDQSLKNSQFLAEYLRNPSWGHYDFMRMKMKASGQIVYAKTGVLPPQDLTECHMLIFICKYIHWLLPRYKEVQLWIMNPFDTYWYFVVYFLGHCARYSLIVHSTLNDIGDPWNVWFHSQFLCDCIPSSWCFPYENGIPLGSMMMWNCHFASQNMIS